MSDTSGSVEGAHPLIARATYAAYRSGGAIALALPKRLGAGLAATLAKGLRATLRERRAMVTRHMTRVLGPDADPPAVRRAVREVFDSYARYWLDAFRLPGETPESIVARMRVEGLEHLDAARATGGGVVLAAPHLGGWDFGGAWLAIQGYEPLAVVERLEPPELFEWFAGWRRRLGLEIVPADADAGTAVLEGVRAGRTVSLISDRDITGAGVPVRFFGEWTTLPAGPAVLALRTGATLLPVAVYFEGRTGNLGVVRPPITAERRGKFRDDVRRVTQAVASELEILIRRAPDQWHLMQPNWPSDPGWPHGPVTASAGPVGAPEAEEPA